MIAPSKDRTQNARLKRPNHARAADKFITAEHPELGTLWAAVDEQAHHLEGRVAERRFAAFLAPFRTAKDAEAALIAAGAVMQGSRRG